MKKFELTGITSPGRINLPAYGTIDLEKIDDSLAEKLFRDGVPFIRPKLAAFKELNPDVNPPVPRKLIPENKKKKR